MIVKTIAFKGYGIQQINNSAQFIVLGEKGAPDAAAVKPILDALAGKNVKYLDYSFETIGYPDGSDRQTPPISHTVRCYPIGYTSTKDIENIETPISPTWIFMLPNNVIMATTNAEIELYFKPQILTLTPSGATFTLGGGLPMSEASGTIIDIGSKDEVLAGDISADQANSCMYFPAGTILYNRAQSSEDTRIPWTLSFMIYYQ